MKQNSIKYILATIVVALAFNVSAQGLRSAYFLDGYVYRHQMNPAFMGERNYVSIPALGNINVAAQGNVGMSNFVYKMNDPLSKYSLTTFMHPSVSGKSFLNSLHEQNKANMNLNMTILSFGFHKWGGFNTFDLNLHSNSGMNLPYNLFDFMKTGMDKAEGSHYNIKDMTLRSNNYVEAAFGHSRQIMDQLTVGAKVKFLFGAGNADAYIENMDIYLSDQKWTINAKGTLDASIKGGYFETEEEVDENDRPTGKHKVDGFDLDGPGLGGFGMGIDLGAVYKMDEFVDGLTLSASVLDLGFISWNHTLKASNDGSKSFEFDGFHNIGIDDDSSNPSLDDQMDNLSDDLEDMFTFYDNGVASKRTTALNATLNIGAEYALPYYKNLTFGFLSSTRFNKPFTWTEGRFYANVAPINWFDASINYAASNFGSSFGWILNFHPKGFNFFVGADHMIFKVNPQFVPINNLNANVSFGFNVTFGDGPKKFCCKK